MSGWSVFGLLVSGGFLTALGGFAQSLWSERGEERRAKRKREEDIADRNFNVKRKAYFEALKEFNLSGLKKFHGIGDYALSEEELLRRNSAMTLFDMYAPDRIKMKAAECIRLFQIPIPTDQAGKRKLNLEVIDALRDLNDEARKDLGLS